MATRDDDFEAASTRAAGLVVGAVGRVLEVLELDARLEVLPASAPLAPLAEVLARDGHRIAAVSGHADGANVLLGEAGTLCAFDAGTPEERAQWVAGAVAAAVAEDTAGGSGPRGR